MAFKQKTWTDRVAEFINRRLLTKEDGSTELVTVARSEGTVSTEGDGFTAANMNDLEQRIADEFSELYNALNLRYNTETDNIEVYYNGEWIVWKNASIQELKALIPTMAANSQNGYIVEITGSNYVKYSTYLAFDNNDTTYSQCSNNSNVTFNVNIIFPSNVCAKRLYLQFPWVTRTSSCILSASTDGSSYDTLTSFEVNATIGNYYDITFENDNNYKYYRLSFGTGIHYSDSVYLFGINTLQLYGRE